jgi:hypothetical protein
MATEPRRRSVTRVLRSTTSRLIRPENGDGDGKGDGDIHVVAGVERTWRRSRKEVAKQNDDDLLKIGQASPESQLTIPKGDWNRGWVGNQVGK